MLSLVHITSLTSPKSEFPFKKTKKHSMKRYISSPTFTSNPVTIKQQSMQWNPRPWQNSKDSQDQVRRRLRCI